MNDTDLPGVLLALGDGEGEGDGEELDPGDGSGQPQEVTGSSSSLYTSRVS